MNETKTYTLLEAEVAEIRESYARVVAGQCAPDEQHCTCVPALRQRIAELEAEKRRIEDRMIALSKGSNVTVRT